MIRIVSLQKLNNLAKLLPRCYCSAVPVDLKDPELMKNESAAKFYAKVFGKYGKILVLA